MAQVHPHLTPLVDMPQDTAVVHPEDSLEDPLEDTVVDPREHSLVDKVVALPETSPEILVATKAHMDSETHDNLMETSHNPNFTPTPIPTRNTTFNHLKTQTLVYSKFVEL